MKNTIILKKEHIKAIISFVIIIAVVFGGAVNVQAADSGFLTNNIIPPEGRLFLPESWATRGTVVMALYNMANSRMLPAAAPGGMQSDDTVRTALKGFTDVPKDSPYYMAVSFCASMGYANGYPDGTFRPGGYISRAEMCAVLCRFLSLEPGGQAALAPPDVASGHWAFEPILTVIGTGIMSGYNDKTFRPENRLTRAELAAIIVNTKHPAPPGFIREFEDVTKKHWAYGYVACVSAPPTPEPSPFETEVVKLVNAARAKAGAGELRIDPLLCEIARIKAQDMIDNNYFDHKSPKYGYPDDMMEAFGLTFTYLGENIAYGSKTPADVVANWINSPSHYNNMIGPGYNKTGVGCVTSENGTIFWVQEFAA